MIPSIDHSLLSPSGRMSKAARARALKREAARLFPPGFWDVAPPTAAELAAQKVIALRRHAKTLRDLAARGMSRRRFLREAAELDAEAASIEAEQGTER